MKTLLSFSFFFSYWCIQAQFSCATAISLADGYTSGTITTPGTSVSSTESWVATASTDGNTSANGFTRPDVYTFQYTTGATAGESIYFTIECDYMVDGEHSIGIWTGCSGTTLSGCITSTYKFDNVLGVCAKNLAANTTYYIGVGKEWASSANTVAGADSRKLKFKVVDFTVETSLTVPSDECATAALINVAEPYSGSTRCTYSASAGSPSSFPNSCGSIENDSWMKFTAGSATVVIDYSVSNCTNDYGVQLAVFSGSCASMSMLNGSCINYASNNSSGTWTFNGLTIGNTYYIRTDGYAGDLCSYAFNPVSGVVVLPVELSDFRAEALSSGYNKISWKTLSEHNSAYFLPEKSDNGEDFYALDEIKAAGESTSLIYYQILDKSEGPQTVYYRLKSVDRDGKFSYSDIRSLQNSLHREVAVYPNPSSTGHFQVDLNDFDNLQEIRVLNSLGMTVFTQQTNHCTTLDLSFLTDGIYQVKLLGTNRVTEQKVSIKK
ncbi:MAG: T9SS type A sorting domain-containing protein [Bacteroidota bacterium]